jgi:hypothetical protein
VQLAIEGIVQDATAKMLTDREAGDMFVNVFGDFMNGSSAPLAKNAMLAEKRGCVSWFRRRAESEPDIGKHLAKELGYDAGTSELAAKLNQLGQADVIKLLGELDTQYDEIADVMGLPFQECQAKVPALMEKIKESKNPFSNLLLPAFTRLREEEERLDRVRWAMVRAAIKIRGEGESALSKVTDPFDGKPFQYTGLEGGAFELKSALVRDNHQIVMTFGRILAKKD